MTPPVSILLPTLNERAFVHDCLDSLSAQDYPYIDEILVIDGGSIDGTRDTVERFGGVVRLVDNPKVTAAAAMNTGIEAARNEVIVRADAHTVYAADYVTASVTSLLRTDAAVVGGAMRAVGITPFGRAVAAVTSSPFGVGPGRFHYSDELEDVDTVYLGTFRRATVVDAGGYDDETIQWAAEDQELNFRIRQRGGRIVLDPSIHSQYFPRQTPRALIRQYHNYGLCKASTLAKHKTLPYWRPVAPAALVGGSMTWAVFFAARRQPLRALLPLLAYLIGASAVAGRLSRERGVAPHRALGALSICHWCYGFGLWRGLGRMVAGRPFDNRPRNPSKRSAP